MIRNNFLKNGLVGFNSPAHPPKVEIYTVILKTKCLFFIHTYIGSKRHFQLCLLQFRRSKSSDLINNNFMVPTYQYPKNPYFLSLVSIFYFRTCEYHRRLIQVGVVFLIQNRRRVTVQFLKKPSRRIDQILPAPPPKSTSCHFLTFYQI